VTPSDHKEETEEDSEDTLDELLSGGVASSAGVQEKCSHSEGSPGDAGIFVDDKEMLVCWTVVREM
jgi:hypothetical protein